MKAFSKLLLGVGAVGAVVAVGSLVVELSERRRAGTVRSTVPRSGAAGSMFVGAVDEVELGPTVSIDAFDPEEVPSEHPEINELRSKMPFG